MKGEETITMTKEEIRRLKTINELVDKKINRPILTVKYQSKRKTSCLIHSFFPLDLKER